MAVLQPLPSPWDPVAEPGPQLAALARAAAGRRIAGSTKRVWPVVGALSGRRVLIAGAGSVGSRIAEDLVRSGVGAFTVIDPDRVDAPNLARTVYSAADIGVPKPDALARRLRAIDPAVVVDRHATPLGTIDLPQALAGVSLVIAATDDMTEQALLAHHAYAAGAAAGRVRAVQEGSRWGSCAQCARGGDGMLVVRSGRGNAVGLLPAWPGLRSSRPPGRRIRARPVHTPCRRRRRIRRARAARRPPIAGRQAPQAAAQSAAHARTDRHHPRVGLLQDRVRRDGPSARTSERLGASGPRTQIARYAEPVRFLRWTRRQAPRSRPSSANIGSRQHRIPGRAPARAGPLFRQPRPPDTGEIP